MASAAMNVNDENVNDENVNDENVNDDGQQRTT